MPAPRPRQPADPGRGSAATPRARLSIRLTPRGGVDALDLPDPSGLILARVRAAPVGGAANDALLRLVADRLGVPRRDVALVSGAQARRKLVEVVGLAQDEAMARLRAGPLRG